MIALNKTLLLDLLSQPTAPFKEGHVLSWIRTILKEHNIPHFLDRHQNIVLGVSSLRDYRALLKSKTNRPLFLFAAHMDHPGFHGSEWISEKLLQVKWHGGTPTSHLEGSSVWIQTDASSKTPWRESGRIHKATLSTHGRSIDTALVELEKPIDFKIKPSQVMGGFQFKAPVWSENELIYTHAADDLVGCFSILSLALQYLAPQKQKRKTRPRSQNKKALLTPPFLGLLTRAEEVGFIGALAHLDCEDLARAKAKVHFISLETSRTLPGAEIGKGPIVRLGDRFTVFDPGLLRGLIEVAEKTLPGKYQKRIMDGGSCEATASSAFGLPSMGISIPLGNYHNQSLEGGEGAAPAGGPAPEFVHEGDIHGMLHLCEGLILSEFNWMDPWRSKRKELKNLLRNYSRLLKQSP